MKRNVFCFPDIFHYTSLPMLIFLYFSCLIVKGQDHICFPYLFIDKFIGDQSATFTISYEKNKRCSIKTFVFGINIDNCGGCFTLDIKVATLGVMINNNIN